jgi:hypothetical protein
VRAAPAARKLNTIEKRRQDQSSLSRRGDYRNEGYNPEKLSRVRFPMKVVYVSRNYARHRASRSLSYRRRYNVPHEANTSIGMPMTRRWQTDDGSRDAEEIYFAWMRQEKSCDKMLENRRRDSRHLSSRRRPIIPYKRDRNLRTPCETSNVAMLTEDTIFCADEPREVTRHARKPMPGVTTQSKDSIFTEDERREAIRHDAGKPTPSVATQTQNTKSSQGNIGEPHDRLLASRPRASRS